MHTKDCRAVVKAAGGAAGLAEGQFEAIVSVFGNEDSMGDVVMPGAFKADIARWEASGDRIPLIFSHDWGNLRSHVGSVIKAEERPEGLWVRAEIEDRDISVDAELLYRKLKGRRIKEFSFAYDIEDAGWGVRDNSEVYELRQLKVHEVGPCLKGANEETELLVVKARGFAAAAKAGRVLSQSNFDRLASAHAALGEVLDSAMPEEPKTSTPPGVVKTEEPSQANEPPSVDTEPDGALSTPVATSAARRALAVARIINLS